MDDLKNILMNGKYKKLLIIGGLLLLVITFKPWVQIGAGERGIVQNFGAVQDLEELCERSLFHVRRRALSRLGFQNLHDVWETF